MTKTAVPTGRTLGGRYELHALIGQGTFGRVYRGRDRRLARAVAIKVIKPWWTEDPEWAQRFEREAQLMARVNHPGIVQIYDIGYAEEGLYYVAELVDGRSLAERLRHGRLPPAEARDIAEQLCRALAAAHAQRVVHRDVKPANVLLAPGRRVKVGDFGVARLAEGGGDGPAGTILGTPRYMAPEQAQGRAPTPATDVYGVGVVLYEMLAGRPPFTERSPVELALRHLQDPVPPLPDRTPPALAEVVRQALAKDPAERYADAHQMADALARARAGVGASSTWAAPAPHGRADAPREIPATRVRARMSRRRNVNPAEARRYRALLAAVLMLLAGLVAAAVLTSGDRVRVPDLRNLSSATIANRVHALNLRAALARRYDQAPAGTVIAQVPAPGTSVDGGSTVRVTLSAGPPPVAVPQLVGERLIDAQAILQRLGLTATVTQVAAPAVTPGLVVQQSPAAAADLARGGAVALSVAETPRWRSIASFAADGGGRSGPFRIRGTRWRVLYTMAYDGGCTLLFFCSGPSATVSDVNSHSTVARFDLGEGSDQTQVFNGGPGTYEISVTPGSDSAHWSVEVQDDY